MLPLQATSPNQPPNEANTPPPRNMAGMKPNKPLKSPHKQRIEEQKKTKKTDATPSVTPHTMKTRKITTGIE
jgi:hypothetical protein